MDLKITNGFYDPSHLSYEVVERKGLGHPDTLADGIAEQIEIDYSLYCLDKFGVIPHHNFDKIIIRGGHSVQDFGGSDFIEPIKIIFLGRASKKCFNSPIPLFKIQKKAATKYLNRILPNLDVENYVEFETLTSDFTTKTNWFSPEAIEDLPEYLDVPKANDTATMISYWPLTISEELALMIEGYFYKLDKNELPTPRFTKMGGDIKVMVVRNDLEYSIRINFPLISKFFNNDIIITVLSALVNFFLAAYNLLLPYSNQMFGEISTGLYGTFLTAEAIGGFIGAILSGFVNKELSSMRLILFLSLSGLMLMLAPPFYIMFHNAIILALSPALFSLFLSIFNIQFFSLVQKDVDNDFLGRVFGIIFTITILFMPIGTGFFSVALNPNNSFNLFIIGSCITILSLVFRILFKKYNIR